MDSVNILGTNYTIEYKGHYDDPIFEDTDGYCDKQAKRIVLCNLQKSDKDTQNIEEAKKAILRHELIHGFMYESGLDVCSSFGADEAVIDWIALQFPKMLKVFKEAGGI